MNFMLKETIEYANGESTYIGDVLIRCNNVLYLQDASKN